MGYPRKPADASKPEPHTLNDSNGHPPSQGSSPEWNAVSPTFSSFDGRRGSHDVRWLSYAPPKSEIWWTYKSDSPSESLRAMILAVGRP
jgi:hypothetical protein